MSWAGYVDAVLRPMREANERAIEERKRVARILATAADRIEQTRPADSVAWLRAEAKKLEAGRG